MLIIPCDTILSSKAHNMVSAWNLLQGEGFHNMDNYKFKVRQSRFLKHSYTFGQSCQPQSFSYEFK